MDEIFVTLLSGDPALSALLSGGIHAASRLTRQAIPAAFSGGEPLPAMLVTVQRADSVAQGRVRRSRLSVVVFAPAQETVYAALDAVYGVLQRYEAPGEGICFTRWVADVIATEDPALRCHKGEGQYDVYHL